MEQKTIFSSENVNNGRQFEMDFAKAVAIVLMVICHVGIYFLDESTLAYGIFDLLGCECCAPLFMFCMGASFCYSSKHTPKLMALRGVNLLFGAYLLNIIRGVIPELISIPLGAYPYTFGAVEQLLLIDILQFAGLAMIVMALFDRLNIHPAIQFFISILLMTVGDMLAGRSTGSFVADQLLGLLYPISDYTCFSLSAWLIFPTAGLLFGTLLKRCNDTHTLYKSLIAVSGLISLCVNYLCVTSSESNLYYTENLYYAMGVKPAILALFVALFMLSLGHFLKGRLPESVVPVMQRLSSNLNEIYCVSWVLIFWLLLFTRGVLKVELPVWAVCVLSVAVLAISSRLAIVYKKLKKKRTAKKQAAN